jgi:hypothetical protein
MRIAEIKQRGDLEVVVISHIAKPMMCISKESEG